MSQNDQLSPTLLNQLYRYSLSLCHEPENAYDLLQQAVEGYLRKQGEEVNSPKYYLMRSIRNGFFDQTRQQKLHLVVSEGLRRDQQLLRTEAPSPEDLAIRAEDVDRLIAALTPPERELLFLWAVEEYSVQQIANMTAIPRGTLLSKLHRLKKRVRNQLAVFSTADKRLAE